VSISPVVPLTGGVCYRFPQWPKPMSARSGNACAALKNYL
jgi:hypothetical protein